MRFSMGALIIGFLALALTAISHREPNQAKAQDNFPKVPRWEYKILEAPSNNRDDQLNALGAEGWELVSTSVVPMPRNDASKTLLYFKRGRP